MDTAYQGLITIVFGKLCESKYASRRSRRGTPKAQEAQTNQLLKAQEAHTDNINAPKSTGSPRIKCFLKCFNF